MKKLLALFLLVAGVNAAHAWDVSVRCDSFGGGYSECFAGRWPGDVVVNAYVQQQLSGAPCGPGSWGWRGGVIWVNYGCSAIFIASIASNNNPPGCRWDQDCRWGERCWQGRCYRDNNPPPRGCRWDQDCGWGQRCWNGRCVNAGNPPPPPPRCLPSGARCGQNSAACCSRVCVGVPGNNNNVCR